ncbi:Ig-like domain-containing protein, partial [Escherichia coli]
QVSVSKPVTKIILQAGSMTLEKGQSARVKVLAILPKDASDQTVVWHTRDASVASVDYNGNVVARGVGVTAVQAISASDGVAAECTIRVVEVNAPL